MPQNGLSLASLANMVRVDGDARNYWATEVDHLTPWVVRNLELIGQEVGIEFDPATVEREVRLGQFSADIVVWDRQGRKVVIENQFGPSDHDHFAKVVLYACEALADKVVWIVAGVGGRFYQASPIREEHQRALTRLNTRFAGDIASYGLNIELKSEPLGSGRMDEPCQPRLHLVVRP